MLSYLFVALTLTFLSSRCVCGLPVSRPCDDQVVPSPVPFVHDSASLTPAVRSSAKILPIQEGNSVGDVFSTLSPALISNVATPKSDARLPTAGQAQVADRYPPSGATCVIV
ncbi:hypothetical protein HMN09_00155600 [Mycena chlorophos]|uniref:Secreted protein n=1 Tax=Mycena chlorophos TaxID=658473 RepID=A0A8H6WKF5_MYCCL|nr:hypothetical protein HMN09_00155600 [Mycena chlorophos]